MRYTEIAISRPFEGAPKINLADIFGASPGKQVLLRIPVTGERPIRYGADALPEGLSLENGMITGQVEKEGVYPIVLKAANRLGKAEKTVMLEIRKDTVLLTPLMGFTSWNAFGSDVSQQCIIDTAAKMLELGICEYGYGYINTDSGWQKEYGGAFGAIMPNEKFPDMKQMCDTLHSWGLKAGIYSTPMLKAWGCPREFSSIPGCTVGEPDWRYPDDNGGIGVIHRESNNARQWAAWGFDYLKYDWSLCDPENAERMRRELTATDRDFGFCVTVNALPQYHRYYEAFCNSYRCNRDSDGTWATLRKIYQSYISYRSYAGTVKPVRKGHFFDQDMLDTGSCGLFDTKLTEDEQVVAFSLRAFFCSPLQISSRLDNITEFELSLYCNEEIIAIHQDSAFMEPKLCKAVENGEGCLHIYRKELTGGACALAIFNFGEKEETAEMDLEKGAAVRDVWAKKNMDACGILRLRMMPHTVRIFRISIGR